MIGVMKNAFLIAVLTQKLLLNRWEKHIPNFVLTIELAKRPKYHATNVINYGWKGAHDEVRECSEQPLPNILVMFMKERMLEGVSPTTF